MRRPRGYRTADDVHRALRMRAAETGASMEALLDEILRKGLGLMATAQVAVIEAGDDYTERLEVLEIEAQDTELATIAAAKMAVTARGYRVMEDAEGGHNVIADDYVAITVWPKEDEEDD